MAKILIITEELFDQKIKENEMVLFDIYADWCPPCLKQGAALEKGYEKLLSTFPKLKIFKIDCDVSPELSKKYNIESIPQLIFAYKQRVKVFDPGLMNIKEITGLIKETIDESEKICPLK